MRRGDEVSLPSSAAHYPLPRGTLWFMVASFALIFSGSLVHWRARWAIDCGSRGRGRQGG